MTAPKLDIAFLKPHLEVHFSRSPGPGGQNVNKVNTKVTLLLDFAACAQWTDVQKERIRVRLSTRVSRDGRLRVVSHRERTQARNRAAAETRLIELLTEATRTRRGRRPTRPTAASQRRRLDSKRKRGELKRQRQRKPDE